MSPSFYGERHESVTPEEAATGFLALSQPDGHTNSSAEGVLRGADLTSLPLEDAPYVVFDVETTGSSAKKGGAITEIGALKVLRGRVVDEFVTLVNPGRPIEPFVVKLTGITDRMVSGAPEVAEVMPFFEEFIEGYVLVGHNVHFDCSFVAAARREPLPNLRLDTLKLARCLVPGLERYRLASLASHFGVQAAPSHRALADAAATAEVFLELLKLLSLAGVQSVGEASALRSKGRTRPHKGHLAETPAPHAEQPVLQHPLIRWPSQEPQGVCQNQQRGIGEADRSAVGC